ncbi:MAG TPA: hydrogenase 4 subunit F [Syntrophomonadaceae bacterium]|nr:hydrogenase 4 subunit F [Syntrophomonadaceae bacterium]
MNGNILIWLLTVPLAVSLLAFGARVAAAWSRRILEGLHLAGITLLLVLSLVTVKSVLTTGNLSAIGAWFYADHLAAVFVLVIGVMGFLNGLYSIGYMRSELARGEVTTGTLSTYYGFFHLFLFTMVFTVLSNNIVLMWAGIEATTLGSAFLVGIYGHRFSLEAAWKYVLICSVGVAFALYGTILVYSNSFQLLHHAGRAILWTEIIKGAGMLDPLVMKLAFVFILIGFGTKAGLFPMHAWLPDAHSEAPSPVSSLLSGVLLNCALFAIIRYYMVAGQSLGTGFPRVLFLVFGVLSVAWAAFLIFIQHDLKRLLAYSSIENIGLITVSLGIGGPPGVLAALLHIINHSVAKSLLFCTSGNVLIKYGTRDLHTIKGMFRIAPFSAFLLGSGALAIAGCPPFNIFISELLTVSAGLQRGYLWLMVACLLLLVIVFTAFLRLIGEAIFGSPPGNVARGDVNWQTILPVFLLFVLMLGLGIYIPAPLYQLLKGAVSIVNAGI